MDNEDKRKFAALQTATYEVLSEIMEVFPENNEYYFTLIARHHSDPAQDIVLTNDVVVDVIASLERENSRLEAIDEQ